MAKRVIIQSSFRFFSFLAEKTGGWRIFVQPKLWLGAMLLGIIGVSSCSKNKGNSIVTCYDPIIEEPPEVTCYVPPLIDEPTCYMPPAPTSDTK